MTRIIRPLLFLFALTGCPEEGAGTPPVDDTPVCDVEPLACPECADGTVECSFDGVSATELSCGGCQAEAALIQALCDAGSTATYSEVATGQTCVAVEDVAE